MSVERGAAGGGGPAYDYVLAVGPSRSGTTFPVLRTDLLCLLTLYCYVPETCERDRRLFCEDDVGGSGPPDLTGTRSICPPAPRDWRRAMQG